MKTPSVLKLDLPTRRLSRSFALAAASAITLLCGRAVVAAGFTGLGFLPGHAEESRALDVSNDGSVVVGFSAAPFSGLVGEYSFRWTRETGMQQIDSTGFHRMSRAIAISGDGNVIAGRYWPFTNVASGFRWTTETGFLGIGGVGQSSWVNGASEDGSVLVGLGEAPFRWTATSGFERLQNYPGSANDVSADGSVVVGYRGDIPAPSAWRWTSDTGTVHLDDSTAFSTANGISDDGSVIVGAFRPSGSQVDQAFRWTEQSGMVPLASQDILRSNAQDTSRDGSIIVGNAQFSSTTENQAYIWTAEHGMRPLQDLLIADFGLSDSLAGWTNLIARAISADGHTIVGHGTNPSGLNEAFLANIGPAVPQLQGDFNNDGDVDAADYVVWRKRLATGAYTQADYNTWRSNFGATAVGGAAAAVPVQSAVPEPHSFALAIVIILIFGVIFRSTRAAYSRSCGTTPRAHFLQCCVTVTLFLILGTRTQGEVLDTQINPTNGHVYHLLAPSTWMIAEAEAVSLGGHLVTINDATEDAWVGEPFLDAATFNQFWIGLSDFEQEGNWKWTSGEPFNYSNWQPREPNNAGGLEDFVNKEYCCGHFGDWNDANADKNTVHGVVEIDVIHGDFNNDGAVDAADYIVWRKGLATGAFIQADYYTWRTNFGAAAAGGAAAGGAAAGGAAAGGAAAAHSSETAPIPEPTTIAGLLLALASRSRRLAPSWNARKRLG